HIEYSRIPVLGSKLIKKYDYLDNSEEAITAPERESLPKTTNPIIDAVTEDMSTEEYLTSRYGSNNSITEVLDNIVNKSNNPYFVKVASDLLNSNSLDNVNIQYSTER